MLTEVWSTNRRLKRYCGPCFALYTAYIESWRRVAASWNGS
jgi:hypothetical protein